MPGTVLDTPTPATPEPSTRQVVSLSLAEVMASPEPYFLAAVEEAFSEVVKGLPPGEETSLCAGGMEFPRERKNEDEPRIIWSAWKNERAAFLFAHDLMNDNGLAEYQFPLVPEDFKGVDVPTTAVRAAAEWNDLTAAEKGKVQDSPFTSWDKMKTVGARVVDRVGAWNVLLYHQDRDAVVYEVMGMYFYRMC